MQIFEALNKLSVSTISKTHKTVFTDVRIQNMYLNYYIAMGFYRATFHRQITMRTIWLNNSGQRLDLVLGLFIPIIGAKAEIRAGYLSQAIDSVMNRVDNLAICRDSQSCLLLEIFEQEQCVVMPCGAYSFSPLQIQQF